MSLTIQNQKSQPLFINKNEPAAISPLSKVSLSGRDVIIINPVTEGGGDITLANKIANIALEEGCRVSIYSIDVNSAQAPVIKNLSLRDTIPPEISSLHDPLFIVAPVAILNQETLSKHITQLCADHDFPKQDAVLIEEMDLLTSKKNKIENYDRLLKKMGFQNVSANKLGFDEGAIGYLPTDQHTINAIQQRFEGELLKLVDSYNMTLDKTSNYHLAYISSNTYITGAQLFVGNTLTETMTETGDANFIMVLRQLTPYSANKVTTAFKEILAEQFEDYNYPALYAKANLFFINAETGNIDKTLTIEGQGQRNVNIVFTSQLPKNLFEDFMRLSHSGMASGDQSLSEFLSITGKMPYYDMQSWKYPLVKAIEKLADDELKVSLAQKFVGNKPFSNDVIYQLAPNVNPPKPSAELHLKQEALDKQLASRTATQHIQQLLASAGKKQVR